MKMEDLLRELLTDLAVMAEQHEEVNDSDVEEATSKAIFDGFLKPVPGFSLPDSFGMYSAEGNALVKAALARYIERAAPLAAERALGFHERLSAFQNRECTVGPAQLGFNDFFRYIPSQRYDAHGNLKERT
jgi:hypothetical protein